MGRYISFGFREGKCRYYNTLSGKKISWFMADAMLNVQVCLEIPIAKCISPIILVAYILFYNRQKVIY